MKKQIAFLGELDFADYFGVDLYKNNLSKLLPKTWEKKFSEIKNKILDNNLDGVIIYLPTPLLMQITTDAYKEIWEKYLPYFIQTRVLVIIYEQNLINNFDFYDYENDKYLNIDEIDEKIKKIKFERDAYFEHNFGKVQDTSAFDSFTYYGKMAPQDTEFLLNRIELAKERIEEYESRKPEFKKFTNTLLQEGIELATFKSKREVILRIDSFIHEITNNIVFSIYVNKSYFLSLEFNDFIQFFERYIVNVDGLDLSIDKQSTKNGYIYYFKSTNKNFNEATLKEAIHNFEKFMRLCMDSPKLAIELLNSKVLDPNKSIKIIEDLTLKYKRLLTDIKHQKERITLALKHDFENHLVEDQFLKENNFLTDNFNIDNLARNPYKDNGNEYYTEEEKTILKLVKNNDKYEKFLGIKSFLDQMNDFDLPDQQRVTAAQKIKSILYKIEKEASERHEDLDIKPLINHIEKKLNL